MEIEKRKVCKLSSTLYCLWYLLENLLLLKTHTKFQGVQINEISNTILIVGGYDGKTDMKSSEAITVDRTCLTVADLKHPISSNNLIIVEGPNGKAVRFNFDVCF